MPTEPSRHSSPTLTVNGRLVALRPKETILDAALRSGVAFPNSCRVGGCGTCKCKLVAGDVNELTETAYLLSEEELGERTVLACQAVPTSDVTVEVDLREGPASETRRGEVVAQERLTHDIVSLTVRLDAPLAYKAGQFANVRFGSLPDHVRPYSFAAPPDPRGHVRFCIRHVPGGEVSTFATTRDLTGEALTIAGPLGEFWLRDADAPLVFVAGGSGLPPLLAMLEEAAAAKTSRPATLFFGARTQADLYDLDRIERVAATWNGTFRFVPVLSEEPADSAWQGARGYVDAAFAGHVDPDVHAYLCGPPAMIDAATRTLARLGVAANQIRTDRFVTRGETGANANADETPSIAPEKPAGFFDYAKFFGFHAVGLVALATLFAGGRGITFGLLAVVAFYVLGDGFGGDDKSTPNYRTPWVLTVQLWFALPLLALIAFASVWGVSETDVFGAGAFVRDVFGYDALAAREATTWPHHISAWVLTGLMIGMVGTIPAHELTHRTWDKVSMFVGRWLLAFSFDTSFAIEHVYGHHRYVATTEDPATAPRGRNVYAHIVLSTLRGNVSAWHIEASRLRKRGLSLFSFHNEFLRGHAMSLLLVCTTYAMGGVTAAVYFAACALLGKALLEVVNYMEHYGMVRVPTEPVRPRHSWNSTRRLSSWTLFNLTRHSHHHAQGEVPYHKLRPYPDAPQMIGGYLTTILVALVPPLWHALMTPKVRSWDEHHASPAERGLAERVAE
jgi:NAD(P)H-flavin reductase/ferredoxin